MDAWFNLAGGKITSGSRDCKAKIYDAKSLIIENTLTGRSKEITKIVIDSRGKNLLTVSSDTTCKLCDVEKGICKQVFEGHKEDIFFLLLIMMEI